jgi:hypothetical protein
MATASTAWPNDDDGDGDGDGGGGGGFITYVMICIFSPRRNIIKYVMPRRFCDDGGWQTGVHLQLPNKMAL